MRLKAYRTFSFCRTMVSTARSAFTVTGSFGILTRFPFNLPKKALKKLYIHYTRLGRKVNAGRIVIFSRRTMNYTHAPFGSRTLL